jgi:hypothetical protein
VEDSTGLTVLNRFAAGYGGTSKASDVKSYSFKGHASDLVDILDNEGVEKVIVFGHDWQVVLVLHADAVEDTD